MAAGGHFGCRKSQFYHICPIDGRPSPFDLVILIHFIKALPLWVTGAGTIVPCA